ncbi:MAG: ABC transporter permease [Bacteroidota bacterium]
MIRNYFKTAIRVMIRERFYTGINLFGLSLGVAAFLFLASYIRFQFTYDNFHPDLDRTYRVNSTNIWYPSGPMMGSSVLPLAEALENEFPQIEQTLRINTADRLQGVWYKDENNNWQNLSEEQVLGADSTFFDFFGFQLTEGDRNSALDQTGSVVISDDAARSIFGDQPALGKTLYFGEDKTPAIVTGVTADQPENSHFHFDYLVSIYTNQDVKDFDWSWIWTQAVTYIKLKEGTDPSQISDRLHTIAPKYSGYAFQRLGMSYEEFEKQKGAYTFAIQPINSIWLYSHGVYNRIGGIGNINDIYIFASIAIFLLVIAGINFINLSTARSVVRSKEVGVRKTLGSSRKELVFQFLSETILTAFSASFLGILLLMMIKIPLETLLSLGFELDIWNLLINEWYLLLIPFAFGVIAGIYPAFYLTRFNPKEVLKTKQAALSGSSSFRNGLVVTQFTISALLLIGTLVIYQQLEYFRNSSLGFNKENILVVDRAHTLGNNLEAFTNWFEQQPEFKAVTVGMDVPDQFGYEDFFKKEGAESEVSLSVLKIDENYISTLGMELISGRSFIENPGDADKIILNEAALKTFEWNADEAIGKRLIYFETEFEVIGVVKDFVYQTLRFEVAPLALMNLNARIWGDQRVVAAKYQADDLKSLVAKVEKEWSKKSDAQFSFSFLDDDLENNYQNEAELGKLISTLTTMAVIISFMGLFGLSTYVLEQKRKEISIRKVLGSSVSSILLLLNKRFIGLCIIALLLAAPIAWWACNEWLSQFPNRVSVSIDLFLIVLGGLMLFMTLTVSLQSVKAALVNPVKHLKEE